VSYHNKRERTGLKTSIFKTAAISATSARVVDIQDVTSGRNMTEMAEIAALLKFHVE
jgi:hypothetical protein